MSGKMSKPSNDDEKTRPVDGETAAPDADVESAAGDQSERVPVPEAQLRAELEVQLEAKDREIAELKDKYLRAIAEQENARKRIRQQSEESIRLQRESLLRELLPIVDNLELAVVAARGGDHGKTIVDGIEMVLRALHDLLRNHGVTPLEAVGRGFNPQFHEAVDQVETHEHQPNTVVREYHRGYQIGDRMLRPARVAVAKAPSEHANKAHHEAPKPHHRHREGGTGEPEDVEND